MKKYMKQPHSKDEVDEIVDALVADPTRANDVKAILRHKISAPDIVRMVAPKSRIAKVAVTDEEADDDIWDNLPI
jgi:hypothetical protein